MKKLISILHDGSYSCAIRNKGLVKTFSGKGIRDLYILLNTADHPLKGADVADKIIGKAAASLLIQGGASRVYADIMSTPAWQFLKKYGLSVSCGRLVPYILRNGTEEMCPMETLTLDASSAEVAVSRIADKLNIQL